MSPIAEIIEARRELLVPFVGAGVSAAAGVPDDAQLRDSLVARFQTQLDGAKLVGFPTCGDLADALIRHGICSRDVLFGHVAEIVGRADAVPTQAIRSLARVVSKWVVTLNYDLLFEAAATDLGIPHVSVTPQSIDQARAFLGEPDHPLCVVHLHGSIVDPSSLVLEAAAYRRQAAEPGVRNFLTGLVQSHSMLFLGTQLNEPYLAVMFQELALDQARHVLVTGESNEGSLQNGRLPINPQRTGIAVATLPADRYHLLDGFCEALVMALPPYMPSRAAVRFAGSRPAPFVEPDIVEVESLVDDADGRGTPLSLALSLGLPSARLVGIDEIAATHRAVVTGPPGAGKTELLREIGRTSTGGDDVLLISLSSVRTTGSSQALLESWMGEGRSFGPGASVDPEALRRRSLHFLLDGLDEVDPDIRTRVAGSVQAIADAYPQHRFTVASRPTSLLDGLSRNWRLFRLVPTAGWRSRFLARRGTDWETLSRAVDGVGDVDELFDIPLFLAALVASVEAHPNAPRRTPLTVLGDLVDVALSDASLEHYAQAPREWLRTVALVMHLHARVELTADEVRAVPLPSSAQMIGGARAIIEVLLRRGLLQEAATGYRFIHRTVGDALAAEALAQIGPTDTLVDAIVPEHPAVTPSAVLSEWLVTIALLAPTDPAWRNALWSRAPLVAARGTPENAPETERRSAVATVWNHYLEWRTWIHDFHAAPFVRDDVALARLLNTDNMDADRAWIFGCLHDESPQVRSNAMEVLVLARDERSTAIVRTILNTDPSSVVRRTAASCGMTPPQPSIYPAVRRRALEPEDDAEASDMALIALEICPDSEVLALTSTLMQRGTDVRRVFGSAARRLSPRDQLRALRIAAEKIPLASRSEVSRLLDSIVDTFDGSEDSAAEVGFVAIVGESRTASVAGILRAHPDPVLHGMMDAIESGQAEMWSLYWYVSEVTSEDLVRVGAPRELIEYRSRI